MRLPKLDALSKPRHSRDPAEQFVFGNRRVFLGQRVAAGNNVRLPIEIIERAKDAMSAKTPVARGEDDLARPRIRGGLPQDQKNITGKDRRKHARTLSHKAKFANRVQNFGGEGKFYG